MTDIRKIMDDFTVARITPKRDFLHAVLKRGNLGQAAMCLNDWGAGGMYFDATKNEDGTERLSAYDFKTALPIMHLVFDKGQLLYAQGHSAWIMRPIDLENDLVTYYVPQHSPEQTLSDLTDTLMVIRFPAPVDSLHEFQNKFRWEFEKPQRPRP